MGRADGIEFKSAFLILLFSLFIIFLYLHSNGPKNAEIKTSISRGLLFLAKLDLQTDAFIPQSPEDGQNAKYMRLSEFNLYRKMDFELNMIFMEREMGTPPVLSNRIGEAQEFFRELTPIWEKGTVDYSYVDRSFPRGEYAYDLYCILAGEFGNEAMYKKLRGDLKPGGWLTQNADQFRKITDESWCILAMIKSGEPEREIREQYELKRREVEAYLARPLPTEEKAAFLDSFKRAYAATHLLMVMLAMKEKGMKVEPAEMEKITSYIADDKALFQNSAEYNANALYWLQKGKYANRKVLERLSKNLIGLQSGDGGWHLDLDLKDRRGLLAARAVIALNEYSKRGLME